MAICPYLIENCVRHLVVDRVKIWPNLANETIHGLRYRERVQAGGMPYHKAIFEGRFSACGHLNVDGLRREFKKLNAEVERKVQTAPHEGDIQGSSFISHVAKHRRLPA